MTTPTSPSYVVEEEKSRNDATDQPTIVVPTGLHRSIPYVSGYYPRISHQQHIASLLLVCAYRRLMGRGERADTAVSSVRDVLCSLERE
jgi:hypothetical protein